MVMRSQVGRVLAVSIVAVAVAACGTLPTGRRPGTVTIYGRASPWGWFGLVPPGDPPGIIGFGTDGVGCLDGPPGTAVAWYEAEPAPDAAPTSILARIPADGSPLVLSVEIAADGQLIVGHGVPAWWTGEPYFC
jgi:hypothetical protein